MEHLVGIDAFPLVPFADDVINRGLHQLANVLRRLLWRCLELDFLGLSRQLVVIDNNVLLLGLALCELLVGLLRNVQRIPAVIREETGVLNPPVELFPRVETHVPRIERDSHPSPRFQHSIQFLEGFADRILPLMFGFLLLTFTAVRNHDLIIKPFAILQPRRPDQVDLAVRNLTPIRWIDKDVIHTALI